MEPKMMLLILLSLLMLMMKRRRKKMEVVLLMMVVALILRSEVGRDHSMERRSMSDEGLKLLLFCPQCHFCL